MHICWSAQDRLALIRIPLWWKFKQAEKRKEPVETFEYRAPDAFANPCLLFSGLTLAAAWGLKNAKESLNLAEDLHARPMQKDRKDFRVLPRSCSESARHLQKDRKLYEADGVFPERLIDKIVRRLNDYKDLNLWRDILKKPEELQKVLAQYLHHG